MIEIPLYEMEEAIENDIEELSELFTSNGFELWYVGGCVRDTLLNMTVHDYDFATDATPEQMLKLNTDKFHKVPTGIDYGTITFIHDYNEFEITTFRKDCEYEDGRRPSKVLFSDNIEDDLSRRDFTINAIAERVGEYTIKLNAYDVFDPYNGLKDLRSKVIKCVGNAEDRFKEDGLRILRCIRFALKYNFTIEKNTLKALYDCSYMLNSVSKERIFIELSKIFEYFNSYKKFKDVEYYWPILTFLIKQLFPEFRELATKTHNNPYHLFDPFTHSLLTLFNIEDNKIELLWAAFLHDIGKLKCCHYDENFYSFHFYAHAKESVNIANEILTNLKVSNKFKDKVISLIRYHDAEIVESKYSIKRWLYTLEKQTFIDLMTLQISDASTHINRNVDDLKRKRSLILSIIKEIEADNEVFKLKDLAINGNDIMETFKIPSGKYIGELLNNCLEEVLKGTANEKDNLLDYVHCLIETDKNGGV